MKFKRSIVAGAVLAGALSVGAVAGSAYAQVPELLAPWGVSSASDASAMPAPSYEENADGLTYGSALEAPTPALEPDLIEAVATNGKLGYILKTDLDAANGSDAAESFSSPEEALAWQATQGGKTTTVPVYDVDQTTVVGEFLIVPSVATSR